MEQLFCVIGGICLLIVGVVLSRIQHPDWTSKHLNAEQQRKVDLCGKSQRVVRWINNRLISLIGGLIVCTAAIPHGRAWVLTWSTILSMLLLCIFLAMIDAFLSLLAYRRTLPATISRTLGDDSKQS